MEEGLILIFFSKVCERETTNRFFEYFIFKGSSSAPSRLHKAFLYHL